MMAWQRKHTTDTLSSTRYVNCSIRLVVVRDMEGYNWNSNQLEATVKQWCFCLPVQCVEGCVCDTTSCARVTLYINCSMPILIGLHKTFIATPTRVTVVMFAQSHTAVWLNCSNTDTNGAEVSFM